MSHSKRYLNATDLAVQIKKREHQLLAEHSTLSPETLTMKQLKQVLSPSEYKVYKKNRRLLTLYKKYMLSEKWITVREGISQKLSKHGNRIVPLLYIGTQQEVVTLHTWIEAMYRKPNPKAKTQDVLLKSLSSSIDNIPLYQVLEFYRAVKEVNGERRGENYKKPPK